MPEAKKYVWRWAAKHHIALLPDKDNGRARCGARAWSRFGARPGRRKKLDGWASPNVALDEFRGGCRTAAQ